MRLDRSPALAAADADLREAVSQQRKNGARLLEALSRRDTYRDDLRRRRPAWCDEDAQYAAYLDQLRAQLTEAEGMVEFYEATLTKGAEVIAACDQRIAALERMERAQGRLFA